jgi:dihydroorotase
MKINLPEIIIDTHLHGRDMDQSNKTTVKQVLKEAKSGLISISAFMPNTDPSIKDVPVLQRYSWLTSSERKKLELPLQFIWFGATDSNGVECDKAMSFSNVLGVKNYQLSKTGKTVTSGTIGVSDNRRIDEIIQGTTKKNKANAHHCDNPYIIARDGNTIEAEVSCVEKIIRSAKKFPECKIIICHVSCQKSAEIIMKARKDGVNIAIELAPHYLWFDSDKTNWNPGLDEVFYKCFNNLRGGEDREFLQNLLSNDNAFIIIGSDSACHTTQEKLEKKLGGIPSNQEMVAVIATMAKKLKLSDQRVADLLSFNASKFLGIPVPKRIANFKLEERIDDIQYNDGVVTNPWNGTTLLFPKKI